ncbi:MAG: transcriptional accessory protein, partial [Rhodobacteraceae bacterium]|nr:transcriptional accessory protein [Paracoccaceae bacterium]
NYVIVNEAGASVYSASELARVEFPDFSVEERSAASIARRLQDPLSELVKIDPKSIGVGQYQHDVTPKKLNETLNFVVTQAVNQVGVNLNTASKSLLMYVSGLNKSSAENIVTHRQNIGRFQNRKDMSVLELMSSWCGVSMFIQPVGNPTITYA